MATYKREYFFLEEINDQLLKDCVHGGCVRDSTRYIEDLARNFGVDPKDIARPTPFKISRLALYYALMQAALEQSLMASSGDEAGNDAYELKRKLYAQYVKEIEESLTADTFLDGTSTAITAFPFSMKMFRS